MPAGPSTAGVPGAPLAIAASEPVVGCIALDVSGPAAQSVIITEITPGAPAAALGALAPVNGQASLSAGVPWRCDRLARVFQASETLSEGTQRSASVSLTTPPCTARITVSVPSNRLHRGYPVMLALADRWHLGGLRVQACQVLRHTRSCSSVTLAAGRAATVLRMRLRSAGRVQIELSDPYEELKLKLHVLGSRPLLLATGDSEMQVLDELIGSDLSGFGGAQIIGDARQSTAISSPFFFDWPAHAYAQANSLHPDIVAMFIGGNEGFSLGQAQCCGPDWSREYSGRVAAMIHDYLQHGAAVVYWFLIPTPSSEPFVRVVRAVNSGIIRAAAQFRHGVHVFDLRPRFSPGGRYIPGVHESDGFHLSASSDVVVAQMFIARLHHDGVLP
jgi:hypothetical protein